MPPTFRIGSIGELLWDLLPDGPRLGGAPANFAAMSANLGDEVFLISRVGEDWEGRQALDQLVSHPFHFDFISVDGIHPTGTVTVTLPADAGPSYRIQEEAAWDYVPWTAELAALAPTLDAICFGTLAQRSPVTQAVVRSLVEATRPGCLRVFDVNLREPYWTSEAVRWGCAHATLLKMNYDEVPHVARAVGLPAAEHTPLQVAHFLLRRFPICLVAVTRGDQGSLLVTHDAVVDHRGVAAEVVDTVGVGDAFSAALTHGFLRQCPLPMRAEAANRWGAWVATQPGGMPTTDEKIRNKIKSAVHAAVR